MKTLIATGTMLMLAAGTAAAQDMGGGMGGGGDTSMSSSGGTVGSQMAIVAEYNAVADIPVVHMLYNVGGNYLDIELLFALVNSAPDVGDTVTDFTLGAGISYRMYKDMDGRIHPYLSPGIVFVLENDNEDPPVDPNTITIGAGAELGVDFMLFDQFTLGASVGGGLQYSIEGEGSDTNILSVGVFTSALNATFWWG